MDQVDIFTCANFCKNVTNLAGEFRQHKSQDKKMASLKGN